MVSNRQPLVYKQAPAYFKTFAQNRLGIYFKVDRFLFQNRQVPALKRRAHFSEQAGACFKQHLPFRVILLTKISRNQETIPSKNASASSKQGATGLQQVGVCSNRRKQALNS